jgi:hypothetical protein
VTPCPADFEQRACGVEIDPHAQVEVRFGHSADDGREMEDRRRVRIDRGLQEPRIADISCDLPNASIRHRRAGDDVDQRDAIDDRAAVVRRTERASQERLGKATAKKTGAARDNHVHQSA